MRGTPGLRSFEHPALSISCLGDDVNSKQARFLLRGYRAGGADAHDSLFSEALDQATHDPALAAWFESERNLDKKISVLLGEVRPPADLRDMLLAGGRATEIDVARKKRRRSSRGMAVAAGFVILLSSLMAWSVRRPSGRTLMEFALRDAAEPQRHDRLHGQLNPMQVLLSDASWRAARGWPVGFSGLKAAGCRRLECDGREIFEICFRRGGARYHCYVTQKIDFSSPATEDQPFIKNFGPSSAALWADDFLLYVMVSEAGRVGLEKIL